MILGRRRTRNLLETQKWLVLICALAIVAFATADGIADEGPLVVDWRRAFPTTFDIQDVRWAMCPDDSLVFWSQDDGTMEFDPEGGSKLRETDRLFEGLRALSCGDDGRLYVAGSTGSRRHSSLAILERSTEGYETNERAELDVAVTSLAAGHSGIVATGRDERNDYPLHRVGSTGKTVRSFGERDSARSDLFLHGTLFWGSNGQTIVFAPTFLPEIQVYDSDGRRIAVKGLGLGRPALSERVRRHKGNLFEYIQYAVSQRGEQFVVGAAPLPHSGIVVQHVSRWHTDLGGTAIILTFLDAHLDDLLHVADRGWGRLLAADSKGAMYFLKERWLTRVFADRIHEPEPVDKRSVDRASSRTSRSVNAAAE